MTFTDEQLADIQRHNNSKSRIRKIKSDINKLELWVDVLEDCLDTEDNHDLISSIALAVEDLLVTAECPY